MPRNFTTRQAHTKELIHNLRCLREHFAKRLDFAAALCDVMIV